MCTRHAVLLVNRGQLAMVPCPVFEIAHPSYVYVLWGQRSGGLGLELCLLTLNSVCPVLLIHFLSLQDRELRLEVNSYPSPVLSLRSVVSVYICVFVCTRH